MLEDLQLIRPGEVRVRIAPSPTGPMHIGLARTALFNYLFAKKYRGTFVLRIEDTDEERSRREYEEEIKDGLKWLGLEYDEGPDIGGAFGPYRQSERKEIYKKYIERLINEEKVYYCFCSIEELEAHRQYLLSIGQPPRYSEKCRHLTKKEVEEKIKEGKPYVLRLKTPAKKVVFEDMLRGKIESDSLVFGDIVIAKNEETPLYNLAVVIDDYEMRISHIIRGEDHISNTPKQILLAEALRITPPKYLHLPLILGPDKAKLSKRHQAESLLAYKQKGYLPEAIINFLAFLGWNPRSNREIFSLSSLIQEFSLNGLQKSGAVFNEQKLEWLNSFYLRQKSKEKLVELCLPYLMEAGLIESISSEKKISAVSSYPPALLPQNFKVRESGENISLNELLKIVALYQERIKTLSEISELTDFFFKKELDYPAELLKWKEMGNKEIKENLEKAKKSLEKIKEDDWKKENIEKNLLKIAEEEGKGDRGRILWPLRAALSGKKASAGPFEIAEILGKEKTLQRIKDALKKLATSTF